MAKYKFTVCGGTFDLFHKGHKELIKKALSVSDRVLIGVTSDVYIKTLKNNLGVETYLKRRKTVADFIKFMGATNRTKIVSINSAYEPYLETDKEYQAIVVTRQTKKAADDINLKRKNNLIKPLDIVIVEPVLAEDGESISSTRIRNGEINRNGNLYINPKWENKKLILPQNLRNEFKKPWGKVIKDIPANINSLKTIVVGDYTAKFFNTRNIGQLLSIIDFKIKREIKYKNISELGFITEKSKIIVNPPGVISWKLIKIITEFITSKKRKVIVINGEDDLAVLPVLLSAPLGYMVFYGQPDIGMVKVEVSEEIKQRAFFMAKKFNLKTV